ncbi:hypothetical protein [Brevundimonas sp. SL130]|uniref:hypothetical protein n=1 Tax=Brevundimonas sp. SL130 TaxID=2995143 RepID=UPI00226C868C|nr:hypothetical protein [Brevundimonas sp. SL130]WAC59660.1 hypothetical protein OU998_15805 [Brevundimonas sp. SL130]
MFDIGHLKQRFSQYAALWVAGFLISGAAILVGMLFMDLMAAADLVLPALLALVALILGVGVVASFLSGRTLGTKLAVLLAAVLLVLPLLWSPVSAAVVIAFFADRSIEYSVAYADFQIAIASVLYPLSELFLGGAVFSAVWAGFQFFASLVGVISAVARAWPYIRRILGPEPATDR